MKLLALFLLALSGCGSETSRAGRMGIIYGWAEKRGITPEEAFSNEHYFRALPAPIPGTK